jgi:hypothetical protein
MIPEPLRMFGRETTTDIGLAIQVALDGFRKLIVQPGFQHIARPSGLKRGL